MQPRRAPVVGAGFAEVLAGARSGEPWAFERLYGAFGGKVAGYLRVQGAAEPDALTNHVFFDAFSAIGRFEGEEDGFRSWLFTIAHRRLVDERRRSARRPPLADREVSEGGTADRRDPAGSAEDQSLVELGTERVRALCQQLAPDQRDVLLLRMVASLSIDETARALGKTVTAVKALQRRGVHTLRRMFEREGVSS